jgi:hypothetical protein
LADRQLYKGHDYVIRNVPKTFTTEVLFIDLLRTLFIPRIQHIPAKYGYTGPIVLLLDRHSTHLTDRLVADAGSEKS